MNTLKILVTGANGFLGRSLLALEGEVEWIGCGRRTDVRSAPYRQVDVLQRHASRHQIVRLLQDEELDDAPVLVGDVPVALLEASGQYRDVAEAMHVK